MGARLLNIDIFDIVYWIALRLHLLMQFTQFVCFDNWCKLPSKQLLSYYFIYAQKFFSLFFHCLLQIFFFVEVIKKVPH